MRQFILPDDWDGGPNCRVEGGRARYVARVLRLGPGDSFPARDASGRAWACKVLESSPESLLLAVSPPPAEAESPGSYAPDIRHGRPSTGPVAAGEPGPAAAAIPAAATGPRIILVQGLPKGAKMDLIVRQAAEAGVAAVVPLLSSRSAARSEGTGRERRSRWDRVVREALQQSGSSVSTKVLEPVQLSGLADTLAALGLGPECPRILFHEAPLAQSSLHGYLSEAPQALALCVGPEGGFAPDEAQSLVAAGFRPLRLAGAILRAETAALYAVAAAQTILSERSSWIPKPP